MMKSIINTNELLQQLYTQLKSHFLLSKEEESCIEQVLDCVLERCEKNFTASDSKYYHLESGEIIFNPYHSVQYMVFLYYLSNELYKQQKPSILCDKVYYLNKIMNGVDLFYAIELPEVFSAEHPVGSVMGRAKYGEKFYFFQNCTVGGTGVLGHEKYPIIGKNVTLYANSAVLGECNIGNNVELGAGAIVKNQDIPANSIVFGESPNLKIVSKICKL